MALFVLIMAISDLAQNKILPKDKQIKTAILAAPLNVPRRSVVSSPKLVSENDWGQRYTF